MIEPINASLDDIALAVVSTTKQGGPVVTPIYIEKPKPIPNPIRKLNKLSFTVAEKMWESDERPCTWSELSHEEQKEWAVMARAAEIYINSVNAATSQKNTKRHNNKILKAVRKALNESEGK